MITYLTFAIAVCTLTLVLFMSFDVLRNRGVVDKTREDIEMIKKRINESVKDMKHPVAYTVENYVIIPKTHLDEYNNTCTRVEIQARGIQFSGNGKDFEEVPSITHVKVGGGDHKQERGKVLLTI